MGSRLRGGRHWRDQGLDGLHGRLLPSRNDCGGARARLGGNQGEVGATQLHQLVMGTHLDHAAGLYHRDVVGGLDSG